MKTKKDMGHKSGPTAMTRRKMLKLSGLALAGALTSGSGLLADDKSRIKQIELSPVSLIAPVAADEMRITFCGTWYTPRVNQACNSIFVELGNGESFIFDCGSGVTTKYVALGVPFSRMDKIFLTHLHGDHTSDLFYIYCFGPSSDRKTPLNIWGPSGKSRREGTKSFCQKMRQMARWHRESFSFLPTGYAGQKKDGYDLNVTQLHYKDNPGVAYQANDVRISHFPAIHARDGSISYKLEWQGLSMIFTGDTKPNDFVLEHGQGVDVLIHEMTAPADIWTTKQTGLTPADGEAYYDVLALNEEVIESSHTLQKALGYVLSQTNPRLGIGTHFPNDPDLIEPALTDIASLFDGEVAIASDMLTLTVNTDKSIPIQQSVAATPEYPWFCAAPLTGTLASPKYKGPLAQFSDDLLEHVIPRSDYE